MIYKSLDAMLAHSAPRMYGNSWQGAEIYVQTDGTLCYRQAWDDFHNVHGNIRYKGHVFVIVHHEGCRGMGGMDEGSPPSVTVVDAGELK